MEIHILVFDAAPETLDEHVVDPAALAVQLMGSTSVMSDCCDTKMLTVLPEPILSCLGSPTVDFSGGLRQNKNSIFVVLNHYFKVGGVSYHLEVPGGSVSGGPFGGTSFTVTFPGSGTLQAEGKGKKKGGSGACGGLVNIPATYVFTPPM